ncbi:EAL domain-containing protein [uncultured Nostoc sp.]|uniref:EAL domain-containing protein n=1 Tax=uncultured Nostoc sp. TaxID=340711 RepID=UPI0035CBDF13
MDGFNQQIEGLLKCYVTKLNSQHEMITEAFDELNTAMEELLIASEELKVIRAAVEKERQCYQDLFEFPPNGYLLTNTNGIIQEANYVAATLLSVQQKYLVGKPLILFIAQQDRQSFNSQINNLQEILNWEVHLQPRKSLGGLYNFPISLLKIDRSFISLIGTNSKNLEIIEIIVTLAHKLGVDVFAEGVETKEQLLLVRKLNCQYGQGHFFSVPLNSSAAEALIMENPQW